MTDVERDADSRENPPTEYAVLIKRLREVGASMDHLEHWEIDRLFWSVVKPALSDARREGMEEAAQVCEDQINGNDDKAEALQDAAHRIRTKAGEK